MAIDIIPVYIRSIIRKDMDSPQILLTRHISDKKLFKKIIDAAIDGETLLFAPCFARDRVQGINSLIEKGILIHNKQTNQLEYNI